MTEHPAFHEPIHCADCGAEVEEQDTGLWETGGGTADARRHCTGSRDHLHHPCGDDSATEQRHSFPPDPDPDLDHWMRVNYPDRVPPGGTNRTGAASQ
jgi:hypothetical protein